MNNGMKQSLAIPVAEEYLDVSFFERTVSLMVFGSFVRWTVLRCCLPFDLKASALRGECENKEQP
jgi:hypothetical protein